MKNSFLYRKLKKIYDLITVDASRSIVVLFISIIFIISFAIYSTYCYKTAQGKQVKIYKSNNQDTNSSPVNNPENNKFLAATLKDENISLYSIGYGVESDFGFAQFLLSVNDKIKTFNWANVKNPLFYPKLLYKDVNSDGKKELIVLNTVEAGGELKQEVHIVNISNLTEIQSNISMDSIIDSTPNYKNQINNSTIMKLMFPDKIFSEQNGIFTEKTTYRTEFSIEAIEKGSFVQKNDEEYLVVVKETGEPHAGGLENRFAAVINDTKTKLLSSVKEFGADNGQILTFKGKNISYIYFGGTRSYQGYTYSSDVTEIGLWKAGEEWKRLWQKDKDYWKNHVPMADKDMLNIYSRKIFTNDPYEATLYAWELQSILKWNPDSETFIDIGK